MINQPVDVGLQADICACVDCGKSVHSHNEAHVGFTAGFASFIPQGKKKGIFLMFYVFYCKKKLLFLHVGLRSSIIHRGSNGAKSKHKALCYS